jgi:hypothetical protein
MNTIEKINKTLLWLSDMRLKKPRWKKKHINKLRKTLELTREAIWDLEEIVDEQVERVQNCHALLEKQKNEQTAVS